MLKNRYVRTIILSRVFLQLGIWIRNFAILLYVTNLTNNDPLYVSLISVVEYAPIFIFAIIGGTFADRWRPKRTMVWCDMLSAISVLIVLLALVYGGWYALLLGTLVSASLSQFSQPSAMKFYKEHVPGEQVQSVMALSQSLVAVFMVLGPVLGSFIFLQYGIEISLGLTALMFLGSALVLTRLPRDKKDTLADANNNFVGEMKDGLKYVWNNVQLRTLSATFAASGLAVGLIQPLMLFITIEKLGQDKTFLQWLLMANGAAMLVGGVAIIGLASKVKPHILLSIGLVVSALVTVGIGSSTVVIWTIVFEVISGFFYPCIQVGIQTLIMKNTEASYIGRVGGAITPVFMGMMVLGMSFSGYLKGQFSLFIVFSISAGLFILGSLVLAPLFRKNENIHEQAF
ncbi:Predicted arabinose efflux permease, MFS family [Paenibacillus uliginis N3/975]|uniref:Predicted arabinose efflux permease, MFS family n=1 Tax=Paenibacillus uliginis N3/975 TaxID=1313296 RepID=A0A1X7HBQ8_9BACL|nr:MFS transporter [Paenibacillus uliginis]SMF83359.1 Predicted arabinose efflux permease, MFS family [Paenibacillus uliginis N3/975]